jgi:hypothetical protein
MHGFTDDTEAGFFPADHVGPGNPDPSLDMKLG